VAGNLQALRRRIRSVTSTRKITKAQELVAASRIGKAQERVEAARPYSEAITEVLTQLATNAKVNHPLLTARPDAHRVGIVLITSDRGLCGAYNAGVIKAAEELVQMLRSNGQEPQLYVAGRKGNTYYRFRGRQVEASWGGFSERPKITDARAISDTVIGAVLGETGSNGVATGGTLDELYLVYTKFRSLMSQTPTVSRLAPLSLDLADELGSAAGSAAKAGAEPKPAYEFEPEADQLLAALVPQYLNARIYAALLDAAASEHASRRRAMKSATDNADDLITAYTRQMNSARQAAITQEISEIVGGANALAAAGSEE
jgi:F-type H+-transporting ATPase subunit gamma